MQKKKPKLYQNIIVSMIGFTLFLDMNANNLDPQITNLNDRNISLPKLQQNLSWKKNLLTLETSINVDLSRFVHLLGCLIVMLGKNSVSFFLLNLAEAFDPVQQLKNKKISILVNLENWAENY